MKKRTTRVFVASIFVAAGIAGGFFVFGLHQNADAALSSSADVTAHLSEAIATAGDIASAQHGYVATWQPAQPWLERSATLLQRLAEDLAAVRPRLRSAAAAGLIEDADHSLRMLNEIDGKVREDLRQEQNILASDLIYSEGRDTTSALVATLQDLSRAERTAAAAAHASLDRQQALILGVIGLVWLAGVMSLVPVPAAHTVQAPAVTEADHVSVAEADERARSAIPGVDLTAAADVCAALARVTDVRTLPSVLERAAAVLEARGLIVWMGAGEELFPALAYGYAERIVERMGPIGRNAANVTADAWRSGQMRTVAGIGVSYGAVAAPLANVHGCMGVLAAEVRQGREADPSTRAIAAMIAAQLASIISAWPGASSVSSDLTESAPVAASRRG